MSIINSIITTIVVIFAASIISATLPHAGKHKETAANKLSKICAIVQADSDYIDNDSELYKACEGV